MINYPLIPSMESVEKMNLIFSETRFSEPMRKALVRHFVEGWPKGLAANAYDIKLPNLEKQVKRCNEFNNKCNLIANA
jgi:hypothetical protein